MIRVSNPKRSPSSAKTRVSPACLWPNRKFSPTTTTRAPSVFTSTCSTNSSGVMCATSNVNGRISTCSMPSRCISVDRSACVLSNLNGRSGVTMAAGCGSKVSTVACRARSRAASATPHSNRRCPMCVPSKLPMVTAEGPNPAAPCKVRAIFISGRRLTRAYLELETVIRQPNVRRQRRLGERVRQVMTDVREKRTARLEFFNRLKAARDSRVSGVRPVPQRVQEQHVQVLQFCFRFLRNLAVIGQISGIAEAKSQHRRLSVLQTDRDELQPKKVEGPVAQGHKIDARN